jgi:methionyl-tRNA synthetase
MNLYMATDYSQMAGLLGIPLYQLALVLVWSLVWKGFALWKAARKKHLTWFIVLLVVNTLGILEILYIFLFADLFKEKKEGSKKPVKKKK